MLFDISNFITHDICTSLSIFNTANCLGACFEERLWKSAKLVLVAKFKFIQSCYSINWQTNGREISGWEELTLGRKGAPADRWDNRSWSMSSCCTTLTPTSHPFVFLSCFTSCCPTCLSLLALGPQCKSNSCCSQTRNSINVSLIRTKWFFLKENQYLNSFQLSTCVPSCLFLQHNIFSLHKFINLNLIYKD